MKIVTNNPTARDFFTAKKIAVDFISGEYYDVLCRVRDLIYQNYALLTHPLSGSVKPNETPYKSIALEASEKLDENSIEYIDHAFETYRKFQGNKPTPIWSERIKRDFQVVDFDIIQQALKIF